MEHMWARYFSGFSGLLLSLIFFGLTPPASAQQVPDATVCRERTLLTQSFANEKLWLWQKRLNLQDWNIT